MKNQIGKNIRSAISILQKERKFPRFSVPEIEIDYPGDEKFGDYSANIAMVLTEK